jgi:hypothetical protein
MSYVYVYHTVCVATPDAFNRAGRVRVSLAAATDRNCGLNFEQSERERTLSVVQ